MLGKRVLLNWGGLNWTFSQIIRFCSALFIKRRFVPLDSLMFTNLTMTLAWGEIRGGVKPNN